MKNWHKEFQRNCKNPIVHIFISKSVVASENIDHLKNIDLCETLDFFSNGGFETRIIFILMKQLRKTIIAQRIRILYNYVSQNAQIVFLRIL